MGGQRHMLTQLAQELAVAAAETLRLLARRDQHAEDVAFHQERRRDQGAQAALGQALGKRKLRLAHVRLIHQNTARALTQPVSPMGNCSPRFRIIGVPAPMLATDNTLASVSCRQMQQKSAGKLIFHRAHHHLKNTRQIQPFAGGAGDLVEQGHPRQLFSDLYSDIFRSVMSLIVTTAMTGAPLASRMTVPP